MTNGRMQAAPSSPKSIPAADAVRALKGCLSETGPNGPGTTSDRNKTTLNPCWGRGGEKRAEKESEPKPMCQTGVLI